MPASSRTPVRRRTLLGATLAILVAGCESPPPTATDDPDCPAVTLSLSAKDAPASAFDRHFRSAGEEFGVPAGLLSRIAWTETRHEMVHGHEEFPGLPPAHGVMALRGERIDRGARLAGVSPEEVREDPESNIRAAAALLARFALEAGISRGEEDPAKWRAVVARFSGIELAEGQRAYLTSVLDLHAPAMEMEAPCPPSSPPPGSDAASAPIWRGSPNVNARPTGASGRIAKVIVHTCEGSYAGCWSWLTTPQSRVSAHFVIDEDGAEVSKLVRERDRAWHIGANYECTRNHGASCDLNGVQSNDFTIGVEHAGYASQERFPAGQIETSARVVCALTERHGIPRDPHHIVAHGRLQPWNRTDPGENWPWTEYLSRVQRHCGEIVIDDDPRENAERHARVSVPEGWTAATQAAAYYARGYRWAPMAQSADDAVAFAFHLETATRLEVELRWTEGPNRSDRVPVAIRDAEGRVVAAATVDQRTGGSEWNSLGRHHFRAGWNRVEVGRRGPPGAVAIADAVRVR